MTEGDRAFYRRRMREEINQAQKAESIQLQQLHLRWAMLYQERLDGAPRSAIRKLEARLRSGGLKSDDLALTIERAPDLELKAG